MAEHQTPNLVVVGSNPSWPVKWRNAMKKIKEFFNEVVAEMKKVVWPKKNVLWVSTWMVIFVAIFFGVVLGLFDRLFSYLFRLIY